MAELKKPNCGARLDRLPNTAWHWKVFAMTGLGILFAWSNGISGLVQAQLIEIGWADNNIAAVFSSLYSVGMLFGALVGGIIGDRIGRRKSYLLYVGIHLAAMYVAAASPNMTFLIVVRTIMGFGIGALLMTLFASFTEYVPSHTRGTWLGRNSFVANWGGPICSLLATLITPYVTADANWRIMFIIPAILSTIIWLVACRNFPESPRWLETQGRYDEANELMTQIEQTVERQSGQKLEPVPVQEVEQVQEKVIPYSHLFKGELLRRVILGSFVLIAMNVIQYTLMTWLPTIFTAKGIDIQSSFVMYTLTILGAPAGVFVAMMLMDRIPRKTMGIGILALNTIVGLFYSVQTDPTVISIVGFFLQMTVQMYACFASAVYVPEIWPTEAKLRGSGLANSVGRVSSIIAPYLVAFLLNNYGVTSVFVMMAVVAVITIVVIAIFGINTRKVSVESIGEKAE